MITNNIKVLGLRDSQTKKLNPVALKLALIGAIQGHKSSFQDAGDFEWHLEAAVLDDVYYRAEGISFNKKNHAGIKILLAELLKAIDNKAASLGFLIYETEAEEADFSTRRQFDNFNIVLSEVAKDLCSESRVVYFRPMYDEENIMLDKGLFFESAVELKVGEFNFIGGLFDQTLYEDYFGVHNKYIGHILLGHSEDCKNSGEYLDAGHLNNSINQFIMTALEGLAAHEAGKCIELYLYERITKNPVIVDAANELAGKLCVNKKALLLAASQAQKLNREDEELIPKNLEGVARYYFGHILNSEGIAVVAGWFQSLDEAVELSADYSVEPFSIE